MPLPGPTLPTSASFPSDDDPPVPPAAPRDGRRRRPRSMGMPRIWKRWANSGWRSVSTLTTTAFPAMFFAVLRDLGSCHAAGAAPGRPEIRQHRHRRLAHNLVELGGIDVQRLVRRRQRRLCICHTCRCERDALRERGSWCCSSCRSGSWKGSLFACRSSPDSPNCAIVELGQIREGSFGFAIG